MTRQPTAPGHEVRGKIERPGRGAALRTERVLVLAVRFPHFTKSVLKQFVGAWLQVQAAGNGHNATHLDTPSPHGEKAQTNPAGQAGFAAEQKPFSWSLVHTNPGLPTLARQEHVLSNGVVQGPEVVVVVGGAIVVLVVVVLVVVEVVVLVVVAGGPGHWPLAGLQTRPEGQVQV